MTTSRCQQDNVYAAEETVGFGRTFGSLDEVRVWVTELRGTWWWDRRYPLVQMVEVGYHPRRRGSVGVWFAEQGAGRIELAPQHRNERDVCHELSHVLASALFGSTAHCPRFARVYLELTYLARGSEAYMALATAFSGHGVDYGQES